MRPHRGWVSLITVIVVALSGCSTGSRASDPAGIAVRESHSTMASLVFAVQLRLAGKATDEVTQVALEQCRDDVASAQQQLITASDTEPGRRAVASAAIDTAVAALVALGSRGAVDLGEPDLARLEQAEQALATAARELQA